MDTNPFTILNEKLSNIEAMLLSLQTNFPFIAEKGGKTSPLLTVEEAAQFLNLAVPTIYSMVQRRGIPFSKPGKHLYFRKEELTEWVRKSRRKTNLEIQAEARKGVLRG